LFDASELLTIAAMSRNVFMLVAYDGTEFHGWQNQPGLRTVQDLLEQSIRRVTRHQVDLIGSGRTDAGVHASGQAANFVTTSDLPENRLRYAIGARLPQDLSIIATWEVHPDFHATRCAISKLYRYRIHAARRRPVQRLTQLYTYHYWNPLDVDRMREAARHFIGEMDFSAMTGKGTVRETMVRTVLRCDIERHQNEIHICVEGKGFLYNQVRNMVGTLVDVGRGRWEPDHVADILASLDRANAGQTAPARGLSLQWVRYPAFLLSPPTGECDIETGDSAYQSPSAGSDTP